MLRKLGFGSLWVALLVYAFIFAPPDQPGTSELIVKLSSGEWEGINPAIVALFNLMGIWPLIYACLVLIDGRGQNLSAWPFAVASFAVGAFALLPYLALRQPNPDFPGPKNLLSRLLDSRWTGAILLLGAIPLLTFGVLNGDWADFASQWRTSRFIHVMSLDFCLLCVLFPALLGDDLARRGVENPVAFWGTSLAPLVGPLAYLCLRPPLPDRGETASEKTSRPATSYGEG